MQAADAFVLNGALVPASADARLVQAAIAGHAIESAVEPTVRRRRAADSGLYIMDLPSMDVALRWADKLPTYGCVEVRELLQF